MAQYEHCLLAMERFLIKVGEEDWAKGIRNEIKNWRNGGDASHHLSYGGMGSLSDLVICVQNKHPVTKAEEPWVNILFDLLRSVSYYFSKHPNNRMTTEELRVALGLDESCLISIVSENDEHLFVSDAYAHKLNLQGWRCFQCEYSEVSRRNIDTFIADDLLPDMVLNACEKLVLSDLVDHILVQDIPALDKIRKTVATAVNRSGIEVFDRDGWMRPCPKCADNDTAVYRWSLTFKPSLRFVPSDDNLSL